MNSTERLVGTMMVKDANLLGGALVGSGALGGLSGLGAYLKKNEDESDDERTCQ